MANDLVPRTLLIVLILLLAGACRTPTGTPRPQPAPAGSANEMDVALHSGPPADHSELRVGQWVVAKGQMAEDGRFVTSGLRLEDPDDKQVLVGTVERVWSDGGRMAVMGMECRIGARTTLQGVALDSSLVGTQVKVEGHYRGLRRFDAREISARRQPGRERITGRIDAIRQAEGGVELTVLRWTLLVPSVVAFEHDRPASSYELAPARAAPRPTDGDTEEDEDELLGSVRLSDTLSMGGSVEWTGEREANFDLDDKIHRDRREHSGRAGVELIWEPTEDFYASTRLTVTRNRRNEEGDTRNLGDFDITDGSVSELFGYWRNPFGGDVDLIVGRQDFDDAREWVYDQNLDAVRAIWRRPGWKLELSRSTVLSDGSHRNRNLDNWIAYLSNNDEERHLAAYVVHRSGTIPKQPDGTTAPADKHGPHDRSQHVGVRALGEWLPEQDSWLELATITGQLADTDLGGWALDVGTTWSPPSADPFYFTLGYARTSGDDDPTDADDDGFRQTGLQDNNGRFGGVTSFRYYGELVDPELTNLKILTLGVGTRLDKKTSLDLVLHRYWQVEAAARQRDTNLDLRPNGIDSELGWGADLILGSRAWDNWHVEVVGSVFEPGDAFDGADQAWLGKVQIRYRF